MAKKRKSETIVMKETAQRLAGMKQIDPALDLGNGVTIAAGDTILIDAQKALEEYNSTLALADEKLNTFIEKEKLARSFNKKVLPAIGLKYGTDSSQYEMVGGVRDSERKKPTPKEKSPNP